MKPAAKLHIIVNTDFYLTKSAVGCAGQSQQPRPRERLWLYSAISDKLEINCVNNAAISELMRGLRSQLSELILGLSGHDMAPMSFGLSHSLSPYKLKFSPDKVDTMIVQAIGLLDDLDKELNT